MIKIYLTPFDDEGEFSDEIEITSDVDLSALGKIQRRLDNSEYDIGVLRFNNMNLKLHNQDGKYSDVDNLHSVFRFRRSGAKVRITWAPAEPAICGLVICGQTILSEEVNIYFGVINDEAAKMGIDDQIVEFQVLSYDSLFNKVKVPFGDLVAGDDLKEILFKILDQAALARYFSVDVGDLDLAVNYEVDSLDWFENKTGKEAIEKLLLAANSTIFLEGTEVKTRGRTPAGSVGRSFYGQASDVGNENIVALDDIRNGQNRIINLVRWKDSTVVAQSLSSQDRWGVFAKDLDIEFITDGAKQLETAESIVNEFEDPKREFILQTFLDVDSIELGFLSRIDIDYPSVVEAAGRNLPIVGLTEIGDETAPLPKLLWDFSLTQEENFKIMGIDIDLKKETVGFGVRGI